MKKNLNILDFLSQIPWWVSISLSVSFYLLLKFVIPYFENISPAVNEAHTSLGPALAPVVALVCLSPLTFSFLRSTRQKKLHDLKKELQSIQDLEREKLQEYLINAYSQAGYMILAGDSYTSDPDIDLIMRKSANLYLLQSRFWRNRKIGKREVKKLFLRMHEKQASGIFILTTGIFTREARRYAIGRPINLVDGIKLVEILNPVINRSMN